ncbi:MAG: hypothetical protein GC204_00930 [Chloroflexi bacterium]|nr:hypothetical protein [Chloroflexota bacterium]
MAIQLDWDNHAQTVMLCAVDQQWTWDEMDAAMTKIKAVTDSADYEIAAIVDVTQGVNIPGGLFSPNTLNQAKKMLKMGETSTPGPVIIVGASPLIQTIYGTLRGMDKNGLNNVAFAATIDEARTALKARNYSYAVTR